MSDRDKAFAKSMGRHASEAAGLLGLLKEEERARVKRWEDEKPSLENLINSLNQTCEILRKEKKRVAADLNLGSGSSSSPSTAASSGHVQSPSRPPHQHHQHPPPAHGVRHQHDAVELQRGLADLNNRVLDIDRQLQAANEELASCGRAQEREYLSTKLVVLQVRAWR